MNRVIKFRCYDTELKIWISNLGMKKNNVLTDGKERGYFKVMQFTGRTDKNSKDIYEGDIVNVDCSGVAGAFEDGFYKVEYSLTDCAFCLVQLDEKHGILFNECYEYEVISNIYENPELATP